MFHSLLAAGAPAAAIGGHGHSNPIFGVIFGCVAFVIGIGIVVVSATR